MSPRPYWCWFVDGAIRRVMLPSTCWTAHRMPGKTRELRRTTSQTVSLGAHRPKRSKSGAARFPVETSAATLWVGSFLALCFGLCLVRFHDARIANLQQSSPWRWSSGLHPRCTVNVAEHCSSVCKATLSSGCRGLHLAMCSWTCSID